MESLSNQTLEANEAHKNALDAYTNKLQAEFLTVDKLIAAVEQLPDEETQDDPGDKWCLHVEEAFKPSGIIDLTQTLNENSPFHEEAIRRHRYIKATLPNPFSNSEKRYLEKAVVKENTRLVAIHAKQSGQDAFEAVACDNEFFMNNTEGLDWASIARDVSASNYPSGDRTAQECKVRWLGAQHPKIKSGKWSDDEDERLHELVESKGNARIDWEEISQLLGTNRTPLDCIRKFQAGSRPTFHWTSTLDQKLIDAVRTYGSSNWTSVAAAISSEVSANQCQIRYGRSVNPDIKHGKFSAEEDELLKQAIELHGSDWVKVAEAIPGRTNAQCRDRYKHQLIGGTVKSAWTDEEDTMLKNAVKKHGNHWDKVREEMHCVRQQIQYANRYRVLTRRDARDAAARTAGEDASTSISRERPSSELASPAIEQEEAINLQRTNQGDAGSSIQVPIPAEKAETSKGNDMKRGRKKKAADLQSEVDNLEPENASTSTPIANEQPRPRPRHRGAMAAATADGDTVCTPAPEPSPGNEQEKSQHDPLLTDTMEATAEASRMSQKQLLDTVAASLAAELSDLTDIDDLEDAPPPKKKPRTVNKATPTRNPKRKASLVTTASPHTMRTRSSRNTAEGR